FGAVVLDDEAIVLHQIGVPVVGLAAQEAVEAIEAFLERPLAAACSGGDVLLGDIMVLAQPEGAVAVVLKHLPDGGALRGEPPLRAGEASRPLGDAGAAVEVVVAAREERRAGGAAERGGGALAVQQAGMVQPVWRGR